MCQRKSSNCVSVFQVIFRWVVTMAPFLRIALNAYKMGELPPLSEPPICAIKMKESVNTGMACWHQTCYSLCHHHHHLGLLRVNYRLTLVPQTEGRPWSRRSPPCFHHGSQPLMPISTRGGSWKWSSCRAPKCLWQRRRWVYLCWQKAVKKPRLIVSQSSGWTFFPRGRSCWLYSSSWKMET